MEFMAKFDGTMLWQSGKEGFSGPASDHLLWQKDNLFVMDNHRLALWCWMQKWQKGECNFLHVDAHYDCAPLKNQPSAVPELEQISLEEYRHIKNERGEALYQWDNYLTHFQKHYIDKISNNVFYTHDVGLKGQMTNHFGPWELVPMLDEFFGHHLPWIINLDLDYFYSRKFKAAPMIDQGLIAHYAERLREANREGKIICLTLALSPECMGGWENAKKMAQLFLAHYLGQQKI